MQITEVRIKLMDDSDDRLQAFCSITLDDCFVVRDLKIIDGSSGPFVAMPSRKLAAHCPKCRCKNHLRAGFCNQCGGQLHDRSGNRGQSGRVKLYADIAHPINSQCRELIQKRVIEEYQQELLRAAEPGYVSRYDEVYDFEASTDPQSTKVSRTDPAIKPKRPHIDTNSGVNDISPGKDGPHAPPTSADKRRNKKGGEDFGAGIDSP